MQDNTITNDNCCFGGAGLGEVLSQHAVAMTRVFLEIISAPKDRVTWIVLAQECLLRTYGSGVYSDRLVFYIKPDCTKT